MHLIIAEKNIAAQRIGKILAGNEKVAAKKENGISLYQFKDTVTIGLKGHVVEVDFIEGYRNWRSEDKGPRTLIDAEIIKRPIEKRIIALVRKLSKNADLVTIATDFDTEGELIGKEAYEIVRSANGKVKVDRARFSAITPVEIKNAFSETTELDFRLAGAGEARQVIDLIWGASLTRFISITARRGSHNILSVGRVQSPTLAMIVDREKEIEAFNPEKYWELNLRTEKAGEELWARHAEGRFLEKKAVLLAEERTKEPLKITLVKEGTRTDRAPSPFDTTQFIVAASRLGMSAASAMRVAEDLYMNGYISYPRTDNTVYPASLDIDLILKTLEKGPFAADVRWVRQNKRDIPTRGKKQSTDHPPIHPSGIASREDLGDEGWKVYELVVRRFLATLSPDAVWRTLKVNMDANNEPYTMTGSQEESAGWRKVYPYSEATEHVLPHFVEGEVLPIREVKVEEKETQPPPRYTQSKLIQRMEELGLGTKSTRHEVIAKLISRKYVVGNPLKPTNVGMAVTESLERHADTITKPDMTRTIEAHMQQIKGGEQEKEVVLEESREMLHKVFDELESHNEEIGEEIRDRTIEEMLIGPCVVCGADLRVRTLRNMSQFVGCSRYPDCKFNFSLPSAMWGHALKADEICPIHGLNHIRLVRKGARPWDLGCPLCQHIAGNKESIVLMPSMTDDLLKKLHDNHLYSVYDIAQDEPERLSKILGLKLSDAKKIMNEAEAVLAELRRRSICKKFVRSIISPKRGRSHGSVIKALALKNINGVHEIASAGFNDFNGSGLNAQEIEKLQVAAKEIVNKEILKEAGIPAISQKKYVLAGIDDPNLFGRLNSAYISLKSGVKPETVSKHQEMICSRLGIIPPQKYTSNRLTKGKAELLGLSGIKDYMIEQLYRNGIPVLFIPLLPLGQRLICKCFPKIPPLISSTLIQI